MLILKNTKNYSRLALYRPLSEYVKWDEGPVFGLLGV